MTVKLSDKQTSLEKGERTEVIDISIYTIFNMLTDIGGFLKIITLLGGALVSWYYGRVLHKVLLELSPTYEKVFCYEGLVQMDESISELELKSQ